MEIQDEILINKFGQNLLPLNELIDEFNKKDVIEKKTFLKDMIFLIQQSKPQDQDINYVIEISRMKPTYTPCVILKKGVASHNLQKMLLLPDSELFKIFTLLTSLFKVAYLRRFEIEKNHPHKWWYWDLSDSKKVKAILDTNS